MTVPVTKNIVNIKKETNFKYLNLYTLTYQDREKVYDYYVASRRDEKNLTCVGNDVTDAVRIIPYFEKDGKTYVVLINEFRHAINGYMYSVPAGLVDDGETEMQSAIREVKEETGATVKTIYQTESARFVSAGMTDEKISCFEAEVVLDGEQNLGETEDIKVKVIAIDELEQFLDNNVFGMQTALQLRAFLYRKKLENLQGK